MQNIRLEGPSIFPSKLRRAIVHKSTRRVRKRRFVMAGVLHGSDNKAAMSTLSPVMAKLCPSKTVALSDLAKKMVEEGHDVISFAVGEPDFPTPHKVSQAAIEAIQSGFTRYTQNIGMSVLRKAISEKLKHENGLDYDEDCIVVSNGAKQAAWQAIAATCGENDEIIIPAPYWVSYPEMSVLAGAASKIVPCSMADGFLITPELLEASLTERSRLLILCTPSNPTGAMYHPDQLRAIAEIVKRHPRLLVLSDEIYEYLAYGEIPHCSFASLPDMYERTLTINGFSKGFAMTGWRLGYLAAPKEFAKACSDIQSHCTSAPCSISQKAGLAALQMGFKGGKVISEYIEMYKARRDFIVQRLRDIQDVHVLQPDGAFYVFPDVSAFVSNGARVEGFGKIDTAEQLCMYLIRHAHIAMVPGDAFGAPGHVRVSYATSMELIEKGLDRFEQFIKQIKR